MIEHALAAGVIEDAPLLGDVLLRILDFLLEVLGIVAILGLVMIGLLYLFANGDQKQILRIKRALAAIVVGLAIALSGLILFRQMVVWFQ